MNRLRLWIVVALLALVGVAWWLDAARFLEFDFLRTSYAELQAAVRATPLAASAAFFALYAGLAALNVPGTALVLTLAGGALFGLAWGTVLVSFASTAGATVGCLLSRFLLREFVERRFPYAVDRINEGIRRDGAYYLFGLRLVPIFPFFVINAVMGLTRLPLRTFYWVSQLGMLPGTVIFVNAGTQIARVRDPGDILSPEVAASLALLGLFPLAARKALPAIMAWHRGRA
jgi:uncharacterized membrane protein YdjX (TVP38/TMEM64 family)